MNVTPFKMKLSHIIFAISVCTVLYWGIALNVNVYKYIVTGAIFEMTALIFMVILYALPFLIIALIARLKKRTPKLHFISLGLLVTLLILIFTVYQ